MTWVKALGPHSWHSVSLLYLHPEDPGDAQVISVARGMGLPGAMSRSSEKVEKRELQAFPRLLLVRVGLGQKPG